MPNIGSQFVTIPAGVNIEIEKNQICVKGNKGSLKQSLSNDFLFVKHKNTLLIVPNLINSYSINFQMWGTTRTLIYNMVLGVTKGFNIKLQLVGIGYKAFVENNVLNLKLGFSHMINFKIPENIKIQVIKPTLIVVHGIDKDYVTTVAAKIRALKKPEPYKGKGIRYLNEIILIKEGKKN